MASQFARRRARPGGPTISVVCRPFCIISRLSSIEDTRRAGTHQCLAPLFHRNRFALPIGQTLSIPCFSFMNCDSTLPALTMTLAESVHRQPACQDRSLFRFLEANSSPASRLIDALHCFHGSDPIQTGIRLMGRRQCLTVFRARNAKDGRQGLGTFTTGRIFDSGRDVSWCVILAIRCKNVEHFGVRHGGCLMLHAARDEE